MIEQKVNNAKEIISQYLADAVAPVVMWSSGKDSMVLLWLVRQLRKDVPVFFFREPFQDTKFRFANRIISEWNLVTHTATPVAVDLVGRGDFLEILNFIMIGDGSIYLPTGINDTKEPDASWECGCEVINKHTSPKVTWQWDVAFSGHKSCDVDPIQGPLTLAEVATKAANTTFVYPLHDWTDEDVWAATKKHCIPQDYHRYDPFDNFKEMTDRRFNPDYMDCCMRCLRHGESDTVMCPKVEHQVPRVGKGINYEERAVQWRQRLTNIAQT